MADLSSSSKSLGKRGRRTEGDKDVNPSPSKRRKLIDAEVYAKLGIDPANIVNGRRSRRAATKYVHPDMDLLYKDVPEEEREYALGDVPTDEEAEKGVLSDDAIEESDDESVVSGIEDDDAVTDDEASYVPEDDADEDDDVDEEDDLVDELENEDEDDDEDNEVSDDEQETSH